MKMENPLKTPLSPDKQPGFGPRDFDPPQIEGHEPGAPDDDALHAPDRPTRETGELAGEDSIKDDPEKDKPSQHAADMPSDEPDAYKNTRIDPGATRKG
jgi:hypothetical protein